MSTSERFINSNPSLFVSEIITEPLIGFIILDIKIEIILRGRENRQKDMASDVIQTFIDSIKETIPIRVEQAIEKQGNKITSLIAKQ